MNADLCDACHKRPSTIGTHWVSQGIVNSEHLCAPCYGAERGASMSEKERTRLEGDAVVTKPTRSEKPKPSEDSEAASEDDILSQPIAPPPPHVDAKPLWRPSLPPSR